MRGAKTKEGVEKNIGVLERDARLNAQRYLHARPFLESLKANSRELTPQQYKTLKGQALAGDYDGAFKGLRKLLGMM